MNWEAIGAVGEVVGAAGVIATLGYLALQIRASTSWQKRQGFRDALTNLIASIRAIGSNARLYNAGCDRYDELDADDRLQFHTLISEKYAAIELFYDFHKSDNVKIEAIEGVNRWMRSDFGRPGVRAWWDDVGRETFSYDFGPIVDEVVCDIVDAARLESTPLESTRLEGEPPRPAGRAGV